MLARRLAQLAALCLAASLANAQVLRATQLRSCLGGGTMVAPQDRQLNFTKVYAQFDQGQTRVGEHAGGVDLQTLPQPIFNQEGAILTGTGDVLRVVLTGTTVAKAQGYSNVTGYLSTLVVDNQVLSFDVFNNKSALCSSVRTNEGTTGTTTNGSSTVQKSGCPYSGDIGLGIVVPLASSYPLTTITTNLVALDPSQDALHLACYDLSFTPYYPDYFAYPLVRYLIIGLLATYLLLYCIARFYASFTTYRQDNETHLASSLTLKLTSRDAVSSRRAAFRSIWFGAWAGKQVFASGSLRRYVTPELRELFTLLAWFSLVGTVAVDWPGFAYPVFKQAAWTALVYNNSLPFTSPAAPVLPENGTLPPTYAAQMADVTSPLYLDANLPNVLLDLDPEHDGIERWARMVGIRYQDLWSVCAFTFFAICGGVVGAHAVWYGLAAALDAVVPSRRARAGPRAAEDKDRIEGAESLQKEAGTRVSDGAGRRSEGSVSRYMGDVEFIDDEYLEEQGDIGRDRIDELYSTWRLHLASLEGNLIRVLLFFHLPLCLFSAYQFTLHSTSPTSTFALAVVTFAIACVLVPLWLIWQLHVKPVRELYTHLPTLLALGSLYNTYADECVLFPAVTFGYNLIVGVVVGAVQGTGTAQAAIILICEVAHTLVTSLWLPWGDHAAMGPLAFLFSLARIIIAVLLVVLSPTVNVSPSAASWLTYVVFLCEGLVLLLLIWVIAFKFLELVMRILGGVPFDESRSSRAGGFFGVMRKLERRSGGGGGKKRRRGGSAARSQVARQRAADERRRRNMHRERFAGGTLGGASDGSSIGTQTHMLPSAARMAGHPGAASSTLSLHGNSPLPSSGLVDDDGFIMSAMSSHGWDSASEASSARPGFVKPGRYASGGAGGPILRSGPQHWGSQVNVATAASPVSAVVVAASPMAAASGQPVGGSGFQRVGGGRATHNNPYQLAAGETAYPPYPASSADMYGPRRHSPSADLALARHTSPMVDGGPARSQPSRPSLTLPSTSALLSNSVSPGGRLDDEHNRRLSTRVRARRARQGGFFGRFKRQRVQYSDDEYTDETDDTDEDEPRIARRGGGGVLAALRGKGGRRGRRRAGGEASEMVETGLGGWAEDEPPLESVPGDSGEKGFSVVRKPRPRPALPSAQPSDPPRSTDFAQHEPLLASRQARPDSAASTIQPPHVSVEAPSRPGSLRGEEVGEAWEEVDGRDRT
ncbi:membrane protein [Rhodotorula toruloides]|uniref:Membrane protein n=1 Tax=Rhodotorula toruloides TaxID=5286 RepID=A0A511K941_RHOTO|nr:membrane protein [Rhodotorula toruloides]